MQVVLVRGRCFWLLWRLCKRSKLQPGDLRENVVVAGLPLDDLPSGSVLQLGDSATVRLTYHCEVCKYIGTLGVKPIQSLENQRGFLAVVLTSGVVCEGDPVRVLARRYDPVSDRTSDRFLWVVKQIPLGRVMTYKQIVDVLGVSRSHYRVLPTYMKRVTGQAYPMHRILDSKGCLTPHVDNQRALLEREGVEINAEEGDGTGWGGYVCLWMGYQWNLLLNSSGICSGVTNVLSSSERQSISSAPIHW